MDLLKSHLSNLMHVYSERYYEKVSTPLCLKFPQYINKALLHALIKTNIKGTNFSLVKMRT